MDPAPPRDPSTAGPGTAGGAGSTGGAAVLGDAMLVAMARPVVLYVEDEPTLCTLVEFWLVEAGFDVRIAGDGVEALEAIRADRPDLVITDAMMPRMSGDELVEVLRDDPEFATLPIVMATAAASPLRRQRMVERGCFAVLGKPFDEELFVATAWDALGGRP